MPRAGAPLIILVNQPPPQAGRMGVDLVAYLAQLAKQNTDGPGAAGLRKLG